jgi:hypothetical protein
MRRLIALLMLTAFPAHAAYDESALLTDYIGLTKVLRSYGIEPAAVQWQDIETMCLGLKTETDQVVYNQCRLEKAMDQVTWRGDSASCDAESRTLYTSALGNPSRVLIVTRRGDKPADITTLTEAPLYAGDPAAARQYVFDRCMRDHGWRSARDWHLGQQR